jgi:hypothetical protein
MIINLNYDQAALNAPQSFRDGIQAAVNNLEAHILDNITITIGVSYGTFNGQALPDQNTSEGNIGPGGNGVGITENYSDLRTLLANHETSADDTTSVNSLPMGMSLEGQGSFVIGTAQARALGVATNATQDGFIGMGTGFTGNDLFAGALHEITHAMGRIAGDSLDLFRWNEDQSNGLHHVFGMAIPATAAFFSIDGGTTKLADFGIKSDPGDFLKGGVQGTDPFNENVSGSFGLTAVDLRLMDVLGFQVRNDPPTVTAALTASVGEDGLTFSQNLLANASDPEKDPLSITNLPATVTTADGTQLTSADDYFLLGSDPTISLNMDGFPTFLKFNHLAQGETDTAVFNYNVTDSLGASTPTTLTLTIIGSNDPPVANADVGSAHEKETKSFDVLANDTDVDDNAVLTLKSIDKVKVTSTDSKIDGIDASGAFTIDLSFVGSNSDTPPHATSGEINFTPGNTLFAPLALGETATVEVDYTMKDEFGATSSSALFLTVIGDNDPPVITSGGGGPSAVYDVRVDFSKITNVVATDVDNGTMLSYSIVGGANANLFSIDSSTGALAFKVAPIVPHNGYQVLVAADDGSGASNSSVTQLVTVNVTSSQMAGDATTTTPTTFVFQSNGGSPYSNSVNNFDLNHDFLQFDKGMFSANTAAAVLAAATDDHKGDTVIFDQAGDHITLIGVTKAALGAHSTDILFV